MNAARLWPLLLCSWACGGGADGARDSSGKAGAGSAGLNAGAGPTGSSGASGAGAGIGGSLTAAGGNASDAGSGGSINVAGGGSASVGASAAGAAGGGAGAGGSVATPLVHPDLRTVVYLPTWRGSLGAWATKLDFSQLSYLNVCFGDVAANGDVSFADAALDTMVSAAHAKGVKVCLAIGGATVIDNGGVYATVLQDGMRDAFVAKLAAFAAAHQVDCIDVDLEGNGVNQYYEAFVTALGAKLHGQNAELTAAVSSWFGDKISDKAIQAFDFINVMAYDLHNPGGSSVPVQPSSIAESTQEVDYWVKRGLQKSKAVFGVPFYGYRWNGGQGEALTYADLLAQDPQAATQDQLSLAGSTVYLNSRATIQAKTVVAKTYGGIMAWELGQDATGGASLLKAIADATP